MPYKPNYTDIRSTLIRDPLIIRTVGATATNTAADWKYLLTGTTTRGANFFTVDGVILSNTGTNVVVVSDQGLTAGTFITGATADGFPLAANQVFNLRVNNLADVVIKSNQAAITGITLSFIAS
jgi:hypothetical protein